MSQYSNSQFSTPPVVRNLLIINILMFVALLTFEQVFRIDLNQVMGLHFWNAEKFSPYQFLTYMFMHGGYMHIFSNMFALWMFGKILETYWGAKRFLNYYLVTGIGAALIHYIVLYIEISPTITYIDNFLAAPSLSDFKIFMESEYFSVFNFEIQQHYNAFVETYNATIGENQAKALDSAIEFMAQYRIDYLNAPTIVGASGAVFGILLAFGMLFPNTELMLLFPPIPIKAKYFVIIYGAFELYAGFAQIKGDNIAHFAHLGGMLFGFLLLRYWKSGGKIL